MTHYERVFVTTKERSHSIPRDGDRTTDGWKLWEYK